MHLSRLFLSLGLVIAAAVAALLVSFEAVGNIEAGAKADIESRFRMEGIEQVSVVTDGLQVTLSGTVANETERFRAISATGNVVDSARVVDQIDVAAAIPVRPPHFSIEILRNDQGISLIGLIPAATNEKGLSRRIAEIADGARVANLLESADYPKPDNWEQSLTFALDALGHLARSKISVAADQVKITAIADSIEEKNSFEARLARMAPGGLDLTISISAPRPVITPFILRFLQGENGEFRFDACSAHTEAGREVILMAARSVGFSGNVNCVLGLGVPSPKWSAAVVQGILAVGKLDGGTVTFSDADVTLVVPESTERADFDRIASELEAALPEVFSLHAVLPEPVVIDGTGDSEDGPAEFVATLSPEGQVQLRGRLSSQIQRDVTESYARARFGIGSVYVATRLDENLPESWPTRVLASIEALSMLSNGVVVVQPDLVDIRGSTGDSEANTEIARILSEKLGEAQDFRVNVTYLEALDPVAAKPTAIECANAVNEVLDSSKITFAPGSADIVSEARNTVDKIAEILKNCEGIAMEIGGFTDSQGREEMNRALSQSRAQAVLNALLARRVLTSSLIAHGYGEERPIADNGTEEGREENRRIEFRLILEDATEGAVSDEEAVAPDEAADAADDTLEEATNTAGDETGGSDEQN